MQNMSPTTVVSEHTEDGEIIIRKKAGDFVVCNLSSIHLGKTVPDDVLERVVSIQVRMLDSVIDLNTIPVIQAQLTNQKYRAVGLGTFSWHHLLALKGIKWESNEAVEFADKLYEKIAYLTIKASNELAKEKGLYPLFEGSDWQNGRYFEDRGYSSETSDLDWDSLKKDVSENGIRNGYLMSPAPNGSTAILANGTQATYPVFDRIYYEEKKNYKLTLVVPDLNEDTYWYYQNAYDVDQIWSVKQNAARQRHIDQSISFNFFVKNNIKAKDLLNLHMEAWRSKLKSTYYVKSTAVDITDCESCES